MNQAHNPIICAIDTTDINEAIDLALQVKPHVGAIKLGLEFFVAFGIDGVKRVTACDVPLFLDLKFHDIPNTVAGAVRSAVQAGAFMMTIHSCGGQDMMRAAVEAAGEEAIKQNVRRPKIIGVTVLTSMNCGDLRQVGVDVTNTEDQVLWLADLAKSSGLDGVVSSPLEVIKIRENCGESFSIVTPGVRPTGSSKGDQKRVMTPADAIKSGSNYLVIGRPITQSSNPAQAAQEILQSL